MTACSRPESSSAAARARRGSRRGKGLMHPSAPFPGGLVQISFLPGSENENSRVFPTSAQHHGVPSPVSSR